MLVMLTVFLGGTPRSGAGCNSLPGLTAPQTQGEGQRRQAIPPAPALPPLLPFPATCYRNTAGTRFPPQPAGGQASPMRQTSGLAIATAKRMPRIPAAFPVPGRGQGRQLVRRNAPMAAMESSCVVIV